MLSVNCGLNLYLFFTTKIILFSEFSKFLGNFFHFFFVSWKFVGRSRQFGISTTAFS